LSAFNRERENPAAVEYYLRFQKGALDDRLSLPWTDAWHGQFVWWRAIDMTEEGGREPYPVPVSAGRPEGVARMKRPHPECHRFVTAAVDES